DGTGTGTGTGRAVGECVGERAEREGRQTPASIDAEERFADPARGCAARDRVRHRWHAAPDIQELADVADRADAERRAVLLPARGEKLALEAADVDADGALRLAGPALEAEIEHVVHRVAAEARVGQPAGHREPQRVGAPARRVLFLERGHV